MKFESPVLPYAPNALEPVISQKTIDFHWGRHLQAYLNNLNKLVPGTAFENAGLEEIIKKEEQNHQPNWREQLMKLSAVSIPSGRSSKRKRLPYSVHRRPDHLSALWDIVDWDFVSKRY